MSISNSPLYVSVTSILIATALATSYSLIWLPQVKLLDGIVFFATYYLGFKYGLISALAIRLIYSTINPYGFDSFSLFLVVSGELFFVAIAILFRKIIPPEAIIKDKGNVFLLSFFSFIATFLFDIYTNAMIGVFWYNSMLLGIIVGIPFGLMHQIANLLIIPTLVFIGTNLLYKLGIKYV